MRPGQFTQAIAKPRKLGPETNPWFWNPARIGIKLAPVEFRAKLHEFAPEVEVTWNPITERWQVFTRSEKFSHPICQGWKLLWIHQLNGEYIPLDERLFARLYSASVLAHGSAKEYFLRIQAEQERDDRKREELHRQEAIDIAMPFYEHSQIKNIGKGSKFSTYHA